MKRLAILLLALPMAANADVYEMQATPSGVPSFVIVEGFTIVFDDVSSDGLFQVSELSSFSGFTTTFDPALLPDSFITFAEDVILTSPAIDGISTASGLAPEGTTWQFEVLDADQPIFPELGPGDPVGFAQGPAGDGTDGFWTYEKRLIEPSELIDELLASIATQLPGNGPAALLTQAEAFVAAGDTVAACAMVNALERQVTAAVRSGRLTDASANDLLSQIALTKSSIGCD